VRVIPGGTFFAHKHVPAFVFAFFELMCFSFFFFFHVFVFAIVSNADPVKAKTGLYLPAEEEEDVGGERIAIEIV